MTTNRKEIITSLLEFDSSLELIRGRLAKLEWDSDVQVQCLPQHVRQLIEKYLAGACSAEEVEAWANLVEGRDDIDVSPSLREMLFELANPAITQKLSPDRARSLLSKLGSGA
ncbi:MAG TPA: hypothetical protein VHD62_19370 [Opitutaceae bacterium]|nr:hypothetical protein [Opitutaceae bacterium]